MGRQAIIRAGQYQYRDRRNKKRDFRQLWITRINAAARLNNTTYAKLIKGLKDVKINLNRKVLSELAVNQPEVFAAVVKKAVK
jgi:large subunit ribosomal protein L20